jgi:hypothetical protein
MTIRYQYQKIFSHRLKEFTQINSIKMGLLKLNPWNLFNLWQKNKFSPLSG